MKKYQGLAHTRWGCKYHVVFIPKEYKIENIWNVVSSRWRGIPGTGRSMTQEYCSNDKYLAAEKCGEGKHGAAAEKIHLAVSAMLTILILGWVLWYCRYGFTFLDEGFRLLWIDNPFRFRDSITQFGFVYHPLYQLVGGNVAELRQINLLITFGLAWLLHYVFLKEVFSDQDIQRKSLLVISAGFSTAIFAMLSGWSPTPSHQTLNLQAVIIMSTGLLIANKNFTWRSATGYFLIGLGAWLAFMAKPTTFALLCLVAFLYLLVTKRLNARLLVLASITAFFFFMVSAIYIDGSVFGFIDRLIMGAENADILDAGHNLKDIFRIDRFSFNNRGWLILISAAWIIFFVAYSLRAHSKVLNYAGTVIRVLVLLLILAIVFGVTHTTINDLSGYGGGFLINSRALYIWSIPLAIVMYGYSVYKFDGLIKLPLRLWVLAIVLAMIPHVYAFGSNLSYWWLGASACMFWVLSGLVFLYPLAKCRNLTPLLLIFSLAVQLYSAAMIRTDIEWPYSHPGALYRSDHKVEIGMHGSELIVPVETYDFINNAKAILDNDKFRSVNYIIDLSMHLQGLIYSVGAEPLGPPWLIGFGSGENSGSTRLAVKVLGEESCEKLAKAWLFFQPKTKISADTVMGSFGANIATDYQIAGILYEPFIVDFGVHKQNPYPQYILRPTRSAASAIRSCLISRGRAPAELHSSDTLRSGAGRIR